MEGSIRANPVDGMVLGAGYKTTPFLLMGAASCDLPALVIPGNPMLNGPRWAARTLELQVPTSELEERRRHWRSPASATRRDYQSLYVERVVQADRGANLDFPIRCRGHEVLKENR